jgi:parallel beta-helix repeat protein
MFVRSIALILLFSFSACGSSSPSAPNKGASPRTLFVSNSGSDGNDGTLGSPWQTVGYGVSQLKPGDTLFIRGGTYAGSSNIINSDLIKIPGGENFRAGVITIGGYAGETVTIRAPDGKEAIKLASGSMRGAAGIQYLIFQDLILDGIEQTADANHGGVNAAVYTNAGAHHIRLQRLEIKNWQQNGFNTSAHNDVSPWSTYDEVLNCSIHDNGLGLGVLSAPGSVNIAYGAYVETGDNVVEGTEIYANAGYGLHFFNNSVPGTQVVNRNIIRNNRIHDNGIQGGSNYGIVVASGDGNSVRDNVIFGNRGGIFVYTNSSNTTIDNNTVYNNTPLAGILVEQARGTVIRNNVVYSNGTDILDSGTGTILSNNHGP